MSSNTREGHAALLALCLPLSETAQAKCLGNISIQHSCMRSYTQCLK